MNENNEKKITDEATEPETASEQKENSQTSAKNKSVKSKDKKKNKKLVTIILIVFLALIVAIVGVVGFYVQNKLNRITIDDSTTLAYDEPFTSPKQDDVVDFGEINDAVGNDLDSIITDWSTNGGEKMRNSNVINVLLIGSDASVEDADRSSITEKGNTDAMILVSIDKANKTIKMVSFMRDSYTYMHGWDHCAKLNAACANGGPGYLVEVIENDYKIAIDGYVLVDFDSFRQVIDVLGGVNVDVPTYVANHLTTKTDGYFPRGEGVLLNGDQALQFSRVRHTDADGDVSRVERQRQVISAIIDKCKGATLSQINGVFDAILANVRTNIGKKEILNYATEAVTNGWANFTITEITMPGQNARYGLSAKSWIWVIDYPLAAQDLQKALYGKTNISLPEDRKTSIDVVGGYVVK